MAGGLEELVREVQDAALALEVSCSAHRWAEVRELARRVLSAGSRIHAKAALLVELEDDAQFVAEVDRALARERKTRSEAVAGDTPLPFPEGGGKKRRTPAPKKKI